MSMRVLIGRTQATARVEVIMKRSRKLTSVIVGGGALLAASIMSGEHVRGQVPRTSAPAGGPPLRFEVLTLSAQDGSAQPQLSTTADGRAIVSWLDMPSKDRWRLQFAERTATGWSAPIVVADRVPFFVNWADVPSVKRLANGTLVAHWLEKSGAGTYAYDVKLRWSRDDGKTWSAVQSPHHDGTKTEHGFASLFDAPGGGVGLVWLDGREMQENAEHHGGKGAMTLRATRFDADGRQQDESVLDARVCECCPTSAVALPSGGVIAAYRDRSEDEVRDISIVRLGADGRWTPPGPVHRDNWKIPGCPVNGPAVAASRDAVLVAWFTGKDDQGRVLAAFSTNGGATFGAPVTIDDGMSLGRVAATFLPDGSALVAWIEHNDGRAEWRVRQVRTDGTKSASRLIARVDPGRRSGYPRMAAVRNEVLFAWTQWENDLTRVQTVSLPVTAFDPRPSRRGSAAVRPGVRER